MQINIDKVLDILKKQKLTGKLEVYTNSGGIVGTSFFKKENIKETEEQKVK